MEWTKYDALSDDFRCTPDVGERDDGEKPVKIRFLGRPLSLSQLASHARHFPLAVPKVATLTSPSARRKLADSTFRASRDSRGINQPRALLGVGPPLALTNTQGSTIGVGSFGFTFLLTSGLCGSGLCRIFHNHGASYFTRAKCLLVAYSHNHHITITSVVLE